jgi:type II secretory pathway pseudopilin PulG
MDPKRTEGLAITSLILGILSFVALTIFGAIPAIVCGHIAKSRIRQNPDKLEGNGMATAGLILGYLHIALLALVFVIGILAAIAVPLMSSNKDIAIQSEAIACIGTVSTAGRLYYVETGTAPIHVEDLISSNILQQEDIEGTYYTADSGWETAVFNQENGTIASVTLTSQHGLKTTFTYDKTRGLITTE